MGRKKTRNQVEYDSFQELAEKEVAVEFVPFVPKFTPNQEMLLKSIRDRAITFCTGPYGTGKTMVACYYAAHALMKGFVQKIVGVRPLVECGRKMGFLPGKEEEKLAPYTRPICSNLKKFVPPELLAEFVKAGGIDYRTINTMRGDEFLNSLVILDEAQNITAHEMKMFVTRLGLGSKMVICGDSDQIDIAEESGLVVACQRVGPSKEIGFVKLTEDDFHRHPAVEEFVRQFQS